MGICAKSNGPEIVFELEDATGFPPPIITGLPSPFGVDSSAWPATSSQTALPMSLVCSSPVVIGGWVSCIASLPAGTTGAVHYWVDGAQAGAAVIDTNGNASFTPPLPATTVGDHLVTTSYWPYTGLMSSAYQTITVDAAPVVAATPIYWFEMNPGGYTLNGNVSTYFDWINGNYGSSALVYDSLNRLVYEVRAPAGGTAPPAVHLCWIYDDFGNRTQQVTSDQPAVDVATCSAAPSANTYFATNTPVSTVTAQNQVTSQYTTDRWGNPSAAHTLGYDTAGNLTTIDGLVTYAYDAEGHICAVHGPNGMTGYLYDAEGHRVAKGTVNSMNCDASSNNFTVTKVYLIGADGQSSTELDGSTWTRTNVSANGQTIATCDTNGVHFHVYDWVGTRRVQTDHTGAPENWWTSQPFGDGQTPGTGMGDASGQHFTGKERDGSETGLDYFGARYYASSMGRFTSPDPSGLYYADPKKPQNLNLYSYATNNPLRFIDPSGLALQIVCSPDADSYSDNIDEDGSITVTAGDNNCTLQDDGRDPPLTTAISEPEAPSYTSPVRNYAPSKTLGTCRVGSTLQYSALSSSHVVTLLAVNCASQYTAAVD